MAEKTQRYSLMIGAIVSVKVTHKLWETTVKIWDSVEGKSIWITDCDSTKTKSVNWAMHKAFNRVQTLEGLK